MFFFVDRPLREWGGDKGRATKTKELFFEARNKNPEKKKLPLSSRGVG